MNNVYVCGYVNFPRGGAASNYVQYLAKIFQSLGKKVFVVSNINGEFASSTHRSTYQDIELMPYQYSQNKLLHHIEYNYFSGSPIKEILNEQSIDKDDLIVVYSRNPHILKAVLSVAKKVKCKTAICLVEWFDENNFDRGKIDRAYWEFQYSFRVLNKKFDYIFPISTLIEEYYNRKGCKTFRIPCLADTIEYSYTPKKVCEKRVFVFPANGYVKDSLESMIQAFTYLSDDHIKKLEFHICGNKNQVLNYLKKYGLENLIDKKIILHEWMKYDALLELYREAHFLLLARDKSLMTLANFPSKIPETLTYGIVPICSVVGDYTKIYLKDGINSLFIHGSDPKKIANQIVRAIEMSNNQIEELSYNCRLTAERDFDYRNWVKKIEQFFLTN